MDHKTRMKVVKKDNDKDKINIDQLENNQRFISVECSSHTIAN